MTRTRSWGLVALVAASVLTPVGTAHAAPPNAPAANYLGDTVPANLGDASPLFAGGQNATVSEFPGIIAGIRAGGTRPEGQTCSGTVVAPRKILIGAHCADAQGEKRFVYGLDDLKAFNGGNGTGFAVNVVSYKKHPKYVNFDQGFDVAVVTVDRDIALKGGAAYPKFATSADSGGAAPGKTGVGFGYGEKDFNDTSADVTLDKASLPIVNGDSVCQGVGAGFTARPKPTSTSSSTAFVSATRRRGCGRTSSRPTRARRRGRRSRDPPTPAGGCRGARRSTPRRRCAPARPPPRGRAPPGA